MNKEYDNIAEGDHQKFLSHIREHQGNDAVAQYIKANMEQILLHYIGCTWGACYNIKFSELIQPYFDDPILLDKVLKSDSIKDRHNVLIGKSGAKIFDLLLFELMRCNSEKIRNYLLDEFEHSKNNLI